MVRKADLVIIGISVGVAAGILIASLILLGICWYKKRAHLPRSANESSLATLPIRENGLGTSIESSASLSTSVIIKRSDYLAKNLKTPGGVIILKIDLLQLLDYQDTLTMLGQKRVIPCKPVTETLGFPCYSAGIDGGRAEDIQKATQNFTTILGQGSFGPVYKAVMPTGELVAVKVLASDSKQGEKEFQTEVSLLARLHHRNLVNLVGYCVDKGQRMLVYEFMSNGSLENLLYNEEEEVLSWEDRLQIAIDISHGIEYLHDGAVPPVIHRDLKSSNILLDHSMRAKVADFGLSKEEVFDGHKSGLKGTYGYIDPVYISTNEFTTKSDVYSYGVILFELITAIHPHQNLMEYVNLAGMSPDGVDEILDKRIVGTCNPIEVRSLARAAHKCLHKIPRKRPSIGEVLQAILKIKHRRLAKEDTMSLVEEDFSRVMSRIETQQLELRKMASIDETLSQ